MRSLAIALVIGTVAAATQSGSVSAQQVVGSITVCYYATACPFTPVIDGPVFQFSNTGSSKISGAKFSVLANAKYGVVKDTFVIGVIKPSASVVLVTGQSDDRHAHPAGGIFTDIGEPLDTSDVGPNANAIKFRFTGMVDGVMVTSGTIVTGATEGPSNDGTVKHINFLGGPGNADGPCNDCVGPLQIALLTTVPPPAASLTQGFR
jgi:hypothetical protein